MAELVTFNQSHIEKNRLCRILKLDLYSMNKSMMLN